MEFKLNFLPPSNHKSWFDNYEPETYQLNAINQEGSLFVHPHFFMFRDLVSKGILYISSNPLVNGEGLSWTRVTASEIEEMVGICADKLNKWAQAYALDESGTAEHDTNSLLDFRNGLNDSAILLEILEGTYDEIDVEMEFRNKLFCGRIAEPQHLYAALGLWKIDQAISAIKSGVITASVALSIDATNAMSLAENSYYSRELGEKPSQISVMARKGAKKRHEKSNKLRMMATELFRANDWKSTRQASKVIYSQIAQKADEIDFRFAERGEQTVYEWLLKVAKGPQ